MGDEIQELRAELARKEEALLLAAEYGKKLIEEAEVKSNEVSDLKERLSRKEAENEEILKRLTELEDSDRNKTSLKTSNNKGLENGDGERQDEESDKIRGLADKLVLLKEQLNEAEKMNRQILQDLAEKEKEIERLKTAERDIGQLKNKLADTQVQLETVNVELQQAKEEKEDAVKQVTTLRQEQRKHRERSISMEKKISRMQDQIESTASPQKPQTDFKQKLEEAYKQLEETEQTLRDLRWEKKKTEEAVASLARENQGLYREREEHLSFLDDARNTVQLLRQKIEEKSLDAQLQTSGKEVQPTSSLLGELEKELQRKLGDVKPKPAKASSDDMMMMPSDPKDCEEYFFLAATAVKISMAIKTPHSSDGVFRINLKSLYEQALDNNIPFHEWYDWIREQLKKKRAALDKSSVSDPENPVNKVEAKLGYPGGIVNPGPSQNKKGAADNKKSAGGVVNPGPPPKKATGSGWFGFGK